MNLQRCLLFFCVCFIFLGNIWSEYQGTHVSTTLLAANLIYSLTGLVLYVDEVINQKLQEKRQIVWNMQHFHYFWLCGLFCELACCEMQSVLLASGNTRPLPLLPVHLSEKQLVNYHQINKSTGWRVLTEVHIQPKHLNISSGLQDNVVFQADCSEYQLDTLILITSH